MVLSVDARQNRGKRLHISRAVQRSSSKISLDRVMGILRRALLSVVQSNPRHLREVVHYEKLQGRVRSIFLVLDLSGGVGEARSWVGIPLVFEGTVKASIALSGIPIEVT